jgi:branched-chain amino acid transport system substrate-binding protein
VAPDIYAAQAYDAAYLLAEAIRQADSPTDSRLIRDKLAAIHDFDGVMGHFGWTADRDVSVQPKVLIVSGQNFVPVPNA